MHDGLENLFDADAHLGAGLDGFLGWNLQNFLQLPVYGWNVCVRQIDFVDHRHNRQPLLVREMNVRHRLRLNALRRIHNQKRTFARRQGARHFVGKIDVPGCIEQVQPVGFPRLARVTHRYGMRLDRDAPLALQIHGIEQLILLVALVDCARALEQSIRQGRLPVIDVRDDAKIAGELDRHEALHYAGACKAGQSRGWGELIPALLFASVAVT